MTIVAVAALAVVVPYSARADDPAAERAAAEIAAVQRQADQAAATMATLDQDLADLQGELHALDEKRVALTGKLDGLSGALQDMALQRYVSGMSDLTSAVGYSIGGDPNDAAVEHYLGEFASGGGATQLDDYRATSDDLARTNDDLRARQAQSDRQRERVETQQRDLEQKLADLRTAEEKRKADAAVQAALARRKAAEFAATSTTTTAATSTTTTVVVPQAAAGRAAVPQGTAAAPATASATTAPPTPTPVSTAPSPQNSVGGLVCPVKGPSAFGDTWGAARQGGRRHEGVDMMGSLNQEEVAVVSGTARHTQSNLGGNQVWLYGDDGNKYFYAHLNRYAAEGRVAAGQVVGYMGSTGETGAVHLHFEIHPGGGAAVNPYPTVRAIC